MKREIIKISVLKSVAMATLFAVLALKGIKMNAQEKIANSLLKNWEGDYGGVPNFNTMDLADLEPALRQTIAMEAKEIETIANNDASANFENTILALEKSGKELDRVMKYYGIWRSNTSSPEFREISKKMSPVLSERGSNIIQNQKLFSRIKKVYESTLKAPLEAEQQRLVALVYKRFEMSGAALDGDKKKRYAEIDKKLAGLYLKFSSNVLHDEENYITFLSKDQVGGLSEGFIKSAKKMAADKGKPEMFAITNTRSSMDPFLTYSTERELRKKVWTNYYSRGDNGDEFDNNELIAEILRLRRERVELLGYKNFGEWRLQNRMAKTPENALKLMEQVWEPAITTVAHEVQEMQALATKNGDNITIEPWDYRFYAEKVRKAKYDLDSDEVKQYLQLNKLTQAMHDVALQLFDFKLSPIEKGKVPVFHEDVKVWEVTKATDGSHVGLWYLDPYARKGKRSGAWATTYRNHQKLFGPGNVLGSNNSNFIKPAPGEPLLVSWDDATTFFHEFGHALHFFSSSVKYPTLNGGVRDYTEFQSQLLERWLSTDYVIENYLVHYKTGKPMPKELIAKIKKAATFNQGFKTTEYLASALMDMRLHTADPKNIDIDAFEKQTLADLKMPKELPMRHRTPHFSHVFSGEGYATGYYGYLWADVLTSDAAEAFAGAPGGFYDKDLAKRLVRYLFAPRNAIEPAEAYKLFRGRDPKIEALMRDRGFTQ